MIFSLLCFQNQPLPFPDFWKYGMLALAVFLLLVALIILTCQLWRCQDLRMFGKGRKHSSESWNWIRQENGFKGERSETACLAIAQQPYHAVKVQRVQRELKKLGVYFSPQSTSHNAVGHLGSDLAAPDRSQGKLRFSLLYNRKRLELHLTVTEALDLPSQGYTKTFIQARLLSGVSTQTPDLQHIVHEWQTRVVKNCSSPTFGEQFVCTLQETELAKSNLKLEVKHFDKYSRHIPLGEVRIALNALTTSQSLEFCEELQKATKDAVGEVLVSLKCLPISQRIEVGLLKVKTASLCTDPEKRIFARIDVFCNLHKQKHQKSKPKTLAASTVFNETFLFHLPESIVWDYVVLISIYETHSRGRQLVGQALLGKRGPDDMNDHWDRMMQSIQQPVAKWHPLLI